MSSILSGETETGGARGTDDRGRDPVIRAFRMAMGDDEELAATTRDDRIVRTFLLVDLGAAVNYLRGRRGSSGATQALSKLVSESELTSEPELESESGAGDESGRGILSRLFLVGVIIGLGYVLRKRSGSVSQTVSEATDRAREFADETELRSGEMAGRTEVVTEEAADRIEETGETVADEAADQVRETGEMAGDRVQESGEMAADEIEEVAEKTEEAEEKAEDMGSEIEAGEDEEENEE